ncbi:hypothetical protein [Streptacidiphilus rugosus]|uniref:hypothetical protein n=1 Tax=Streptacidiphilus rugosus TaxID=405783 RepID=UPI0005690D22|nr:hypothetical protein [Streptacidiphilus rugosus]
MGSGKRQGHYRASGRGRRGGVDRTLNYGGRNGAVRRQGQSFAISLAIVAVAPLWLFVGYPLERTWGRGGGPGNQLAFRVTRHPLAIALSAPMRFVASRVVRPRRTDNGEPGPPNAGDREPRHPRPTLPSDTISLGEPRA